MFQDIRSRKLRMVFKPLLVWLLAGMAGEVAFSLVYLFSEFGNLSLRTRISFDLLLTGAHERFGTELVLFRNLAALPFLVRMFRSDSEIIGATLNKGGIGLYRVEFFLETYRLRDWKFLIPLLVLIGAGFSLFGNGLLLASGLSGNLAQILTDDPLDIFKDPAFYVLLITNLLAAPFTEEYLVRGLIYRRVRTYKGIVVSSLIAALIFAVLHLDLASFIYAFLLSLLVCDLYETTGNLFSAVWVHIAANGTAFILVYVPAVREFLTAHPNIVCISGLLVLSVFFFLTNRYLRVKRQDK